MTVIAFSGGAIWRNIKTFAQNPPQTSNANGASSNMMDDLIDEKAKTAQSGGETEIRNLADEVLGTAYFSDLPSGVGERMKERVVLDELRYRKGKKGITEEKVVLAVNELARKFDAPEYAKTSPAQVRALRVRLMRGYPNFIARETKAKRKGLKKQAGDTINPEMSPLEAVFVTAVLVQQKMLNEDFQYPPQEWEVKLRNKELKKWEAGGQSQSDRVRPRLMASKNHEKRNEMRGVVTRGVSQMRLSELQSLPDHVLDTLGIER